jgi:hypothetical protein
VPYCGGSGLPYAALTPSEPRQLTSAVPNWSAGDAIHLGTRTLRVIGKRDDDADQPPVLIVEEA